MARLLTGIKGKKDVATKKFLAKQKAKALSAYTMTWSNFYRVPACLCADGTGTTSLDAIGIKATILTGANNQVKSVTGIANKVKRATKDKKILKRMNNILNATKAHFAAIATLVSQVPDTVSTKDKC